MFFTFFRYHLNKSRGSHNCRCRCCILPLQHLGLHTSVRGKPQLTTWKNDSPVSCVFIRTAFLDFCWSDVGWKPSNQILLRRFQIAKALPRLLRYLLPLWRGRVLRNHGLVNDFLLWAVYTHCHDVFYMLGYLYVYLRKDAGSWKAKVKYWNPLKNCFLGSLASGWRNTQSTSSFLRVAVQLVANFSLGAVFQSSQKATLKRFDTWSLRLILLDAPAGKTRLETPFVMTATLNSHILMQVPIHIWMPEVQQISATVKQNHWISASNSSNRFAIPDFGGHGEAELTWSLGIRRITSRNMVMFFFPEKNHRKITGERHGNHSNQMESMYIYVSTNLWAKKSESSNKTCFFLVEGTDFFRENTQHLSNSEMRQFADLDPMYGGVAGRVLGPFATRSHPQRANDSGHRWGWLMRTETEWKKEWEWLMWDVHTY